MTGNKHEAPIFEKMLYPLPERIASVLLKVPLFVKNSAYEIRLRANKPLALTGVNNFFVGLDSSVSTNLPRSPLIVSQNDLDETLIRITNRSLYTRTEELKKGYLSMKYGARAGVCGNFSNGKFLSVFSINIRIPRQIIGSALPLAQRAEKGLLIAGPPGSGKTTLLRDLVRILSTDGKRVCVIDSRGEICGIEKGSGGLDVGPNTDVITGLSKAQGAEIALRTMFPNFIAFDEVGTGRELALIRESFFSGVNILTTAHIQTKEDLFNREVTNLFLKGFLGNVALLSGKPGGEITFLNADEVNFFA